MHLSHRTTLVAALVAGLFTVSAAEAADFSMRGAFDVGLTYSHTKAGDTLRMDPGQYVGSEITLMGEENLGAATVGFNLTLGYNTDDGTMDNTGDRLWNHESQVYLKGDWGQLGAGRISSFATGLGTQSWYVKYDAFEAGYVDAALQSTQHSTWSRFSNSVYYTTPSFAGLRAGVFYSLTGASEDKEKTHFQDNERYWNVALNWGRADEKLSFFLSAEGVERANGSTLKDGWIVKGAARWDLDFMKLMGGFSHSEHQDEYAFASWAANAIYQASGNLSGGIRGDAAYVGAQFPVAESVQLNFQYQYLDGHNTDTDEDFKRHVVAAGLYKYFSQRTMLYTIASWAKGSGALDEDIDPDSSATTFQIGVTHFF